MKVGFVYDPIYLKHDTGSHVENAGRLEALISFLDHTRMTQRLTPIKPRAATIEELALVHEPQHIAHVQAMAKKGGGWLDPDTVMSPGSYEAALYAAGGAIEATKAVLDGDVTSAFALVRPPGHHATPQRAMGFCIFNNIAIAAKYAMATHNLERIAIIDFDVHHGNGTQDAFYDNPQVLYVSTHQSPFYPGTGSIDETGTGKAKGTKINIPLPAGNGDAEYLRVFEEIVAPAVTRYNPQLIMVSAGYDAHWNDTLALMMLSVVGIIKITRIIKQLADELCEGKLVFCLEGGYTSPVLGISIFNTFNMLLGSQDIRDAIGPPPRKFDIPSIDGLIETIKNIHNLT